MIVFVVRRFRKTSGHEYARIFSYLLSGDPDKFNPNTDLKSQLPILPYNEKREVPRSAFEVGDPIGSGNFGNVHKGEINGMYTKDSKTTIAIKSISGHADDNELEHFLYEIKIMGFVDPHLNLVSMIGSCTRNLDTDRELWLLLEFCEYGDLKKYLIKNKDQILSGAKSELINSRCLVLWLYGVAKGMEYLARNQIMHGDLAARNVLLDKDPFGLGYPIAKVADFGLSKKFDQNMQNYVKDEETSRTMVPWKWMALEYLLDGFLTLKSDVWSFGVLLWEMMSFGRIPYGQQGYEDLVTKLENGYRLPCPKDIKVISGWSPEALYTKLSKMCFVEEHDERGSFSDLVNIIEDELSQEERNRCRDMDEMYASTYAENYIRFGQAQNALKNNG